MTKTERIGLIIALTLAAIAGCLIGEVSDAEAAPNNGKTVIIQESVNGDYDRALRSASVWVDQFSGSKFRYGTCQVGVRCITVQFGTVPGRDDASTLGNVRYSSRTHITIERKSYGYYTLRALFDHELGHALTLRHASKFNTRMVSPLTRKGVLVARTFTAHERAVLAFY